MAYPVNGPIRLRLPEPADLPSMLAWENEPENWKVSNRTTPYSEDFLRGFGPDGVAPAPNEQVFYEVRYPTLDGDGIRRRFYLRAGPSYFADNAEWRLSLERQVEDRPPERF